MMRVKKNDTVFVVSGQEKGKRGVVLAVNPKKHKVKVKGIAIAVKHYKARRSGEVSSIRKQETFFDLSKVMPVCVSCNLPCKVNCKIEGDKKLRVCNKCKMAF